ncbi:MAG: hypothetical protein H7Z41_10515 [Cytophagales bacterium]|nr:hypothetical protein [Armatimonadota bacterium]
MNGEAAPGQGLEQNEDESRTKAARESPVSIPLSEPTPEPILPPNSVPVSAPLESGMDTGQGADDEPELAIGDRHPESAARVSPDDARRMLGDKDG